MQRFNYTFLLVFISVVLVLSMFSLVMDPYVLFDSQRINDINRYKPAGLRHIRLSKAYRVTGEQFDTLILGSSRTGRGLQCSMIASAGASCYNASTTAATPLESLRYLQQQRPATVYLGLDLFTVLDQRLLNESFVDDRLRLVAPCQHVRERNLICVLIARIDRQTERHDSCLQGSVGDVGELARHACARQVIPLDESEVQVRRVRVAGVA